MSSIPSGSVVPWKSMEGGQLEGIRNKLRDELRERGMSMASVRAPGVISNMKGGE